MAKEEKVLLDRIKDAVAAGEYNKVAPLVEETLNAGIPNETVLQKVSEGMSAACKKYAARGMYLDNIIYSARACITGMAMAKPEVEGEKKGKIVLGVMGGPWTIGKNIVISALEAKGYEVFDAGSDVPASTIAQKAKEVDADIVGSAIFMAHTAHMIGELENELARQGIRNKVKTMISGIASSPKVAKMYGVDAYAKDVVAVTDRVERFMQEKTSEMTPKERVMASLQHKEPDRVPFVPFTQMFTAEFTGIPYSEYCKKGEAMAEAELKSQSFFGYDQVNASSDMTRECEACGGKIIYPEDDVPRIGEPAIRLSTAAEDFERLRKEEIPEATAGRMGERVKAVKILKDEVGDEIPVIGWVEGPFQGASCLMGADDRFAFLLMENPGLLLEIIEWVTDMEFDFARAQIEAGADIIGIGESGGFFMSPEAFQKFTYKNIKGLCKRVKDAGAVPLIHCCGYVPQCLPFAPEVNPGGAVQFDHQVKLGWAKELIGDRITLMGNFDSNLVLAMGSVEQVEKATIKAIKSAGKGGGYWVSAGCEIQRATPVENMQAIMRTVKTNGRYPLE